MNRGRQFRIAYLVIGVVSIARGIGELVNSGATLLPSWLAWVLLGAGVLAFVIARFGVDRDFT